MRRFERQPVDGVVRLRGEVDIGNAHEIAAPLAAARGAVGGAIVVDLSEVDFIDCRGAVLLARSVAGGPFELVGARDAVRRVIDLVAPGLLPDDLAEDRPVALVP